MNEPKMISEVEAVKRERKAYENGMVRGSAREFHNLPQIVDAARHAFPLPKVTRPRVVEDPHSIYGGTWRFVDGVFEYKAGTNQPDADWQRFSSGHPITPERVAMWSDLFASPTEEVGADS